MNAIACFCFLALWAVVSARPGDHYTSQFDSIDLQKIMKNDRLLRHYVDCLLGKAKCPKEGEELKKVIPDALKTECSKCSETQKNGIKQMVHHLIENKHDWYKELEAIYDPDGTYKKRYEDLAKKEGLDI